MLKNIKGIILILVFLLCRVCYAYAEPPRSCKVLFDESHSLQGWPLWGTSFFGKSRLATYLMDEGYMVDVNTLPLDQVAGGLGKGDVLVLSEAIYATYRPGEVNAVADFVERGGGILVISEHDNSVGMSDFQNEVVSKYGIRFNKDAVRIAEEKGIRQKVTWVRAYSEFFALKDVGLFCSCSISYDKGAKPLLAVRDAGIKGGEAVLAVYKEHGNGRIIAIGDSEFCWNGGIGHGENKDFTLKAIKWLSGEKVKKEIASDYTLFTADEMNITLYSGENVTPDISGGTVKLVKQGKKRSVWRIKVNSDGWVRFSSENGRAVVNFLIPKNEDGMKLLIDESHYARRADNSLSGLYKMASYLRDKGILAFAGASGSYAGYDAVLIATPLKGYKKLPNFSSFKKVMLLGEFHMALEGTDSICRSVRKMGFTKLGYPLNQIAAGWGVTFSRFALCKGDNVFFEYPVYRGCIVQYQNSGFDVWIKGGKECWGEDIGSGMIAPVTRGENDLTDTTIMIVNDQVLAAGDADILTNAHIAESSEILEKISTWLKK